MHALRVSVGNTLTLLHYCHARIASSLGSIKMRLARPTAKARLALQAVTMQARYFLVWLLAVTAPLGSTRMKRARPTARTTVAQRASSTAVLHQRPWHAPTAPRVNFRILRIRGIAIRAQAASTRRQQRPLRVMTAQRGRFRTRKAAQLPVTIVHLDSSRNRLEKRLARCARPEK